MRGSGDGRETGKICHCISFWGILDSLTGEQRENLDFVCMMRSLQWERVEIPQELVRFTNAPILGALWTLLLVDQE